MRIAEYWRRLWLLLRRDGATAELEAEMRLHRELRAQSMRTRGISEPEAATAARRRFGNSLLIQEASRDAWGLGSLDELRQDIRYAVRRLRHRPGFAIAVIAVLALGIGATTAMFSAVDAAMLRPLPRPQELVALRNIHFPYDLRFALGGPPPTVSAPRPHDPRFAEVAAMHEIFSHVAGYAAGGLNIGDPSHPRRVRVGVVTADFFATLGVFPLQGRAFVPEEGAPDGPLAAVISYGLWQSQNGGRDVVGQPIILGDRPYTLVGVAPEGVGFPQRSDIWIPLTVPLGPNNYEALGRTTPSDVIARLAPGVSVAAAARRLMLRWEQDAMEGLAPGQKSNFSDDVDDVRTHGVMTPLRRSLIGDHGYALILLLGATGMLLLIACANVSHLLLSQV